MNDYILPLCAATINGVTPYYLALFKAAHLSTKLLLLPVSHVQVKHLAV